MPLAVLFETPTISSRTDAVLALRIDDGGTVTRNATPPPLVRPARDDDMDAVCAIVNHYIETTSINFRTVPQQPAAWRADLAAYADRYPWLVASLDGQGYRTEIGVIALPNAGSVALHEAVGFRHAGTLRSVGFKLGDWRDVGFWQRPAPGDAPPETIRPVAEVLPYVLDSSAAR